MTRPIIIDTDPGTDDALAILLALAAPEAFDVLGITTVAGNVGVAQTTANALKICALAGRPETPVYAGCPRPILRPLRTAEAIVGVDGLGGMVLPDPVVTPRPEAAVTFLIERLRAAPDRAVTVCALGPLTNIALALVMAPDIARKVERFVMMAGARDLGNITAAAEFNVFVDPHAAEIVFTAGVPITLFPLDATREAAATPPRLAPFAEPGGRVSDKILTMLRRERPSPAAPATPSPSGVGHPMHDACVIAHLLWPELFAGRDCAVAIETREGATSGRTTIDWWGKSGAPKNAHVIDTLDADEMFARIAATVHRLD